MGITTKSEVIYTCDSCHKVVPDYFTSYREHLGGDRDVEVYADINLEYVVTWAGKQIICSKCAAKILQSVVNKLMKD